jgi:hypothetical protein
LLSHFVCFALLLDEWKRSTFPHPFEKKKKYVSKACFSGLRMLLKRKQLVGVTLGVAVPKNMRTWE